MTNMHIKKAPFSKQEIKNMQEWQDAGIVHEFTCGNDSMHEKLVPTEAGWICNNCSYKQDWVHRFVINGVALREQRKFMKEFKEKKAHEEKT